MKPATLFLALCLFPIAAHSQQRPCDSCDCLLGRARALSQEAKNFQDALRYFEAVKICDEKQTEAVNAEILQLFTKINQLKKDAEVARDDAKQKKKEADAERIKAQAALAELEKSRSDVIKFLLQNADEFILNLQYDSALVKINDAANLAAAAKMSSGKLALDKQKVAAALLEIAFWHGEAGNTQRAAGILDTAATLVNNTKAKSLLANLPSEPAPARLRLREAMKALDATHFEFLFEKKYYPDMVTVVGGKFQMGCDPGKECERLHPQEVSSFQMAKHETTVWQFALYCYANADKGLDIQDFLVAAWSDPGDNPVVMVSWYQAVEYVNWVSRQKGLNPFYDVDKENQDTLNLSEYDDLKWTVTPNEKSRGSYRLPTEAEWEYAAKGGKAPSRMTIYSGSNDIDSVAWYDENSGSRTRPVGKKKANALGLHDMSGNVWEWCWDWYEESYQSAPPKDWPGPPSGDARLLRGGSWNYLVYFSRVASRDWSYPDGRNSINGFRCAQGL